MSKKFFFFTKISFVLGLYIPRIRSVCILGNPVLLIFFLYSAVYTLMYILHLFLRRGGEIVGSGVTDVYRAGKLFFMFLKNTNMAKMFFIAPWSIIGVFLTSGGLLGL